MTSPQHILCDWKVNHGRRRIQLMLVLFRIAQYSASRHPTIIRRAVSAVYRAVALNFLSIDIPTNTAIGPRLRIHHGFGLIVNGSSKIGSDVELRHNVTIGSRRTSSDCPVLEDRVSVGPQSVLLGHIRIGEESQVGAGSVVLRDVPPHSVVAGVPARELGK